MNYIRTFIFPFLTHNGAKASTFLPYQILENKLWYGYSMSCWPNRDSANDLNYLNGSINAHFNNIIYIIYIFQKLKLDLMCLCSTVGLTHNEIDKLGSPNLKENILIIFSSNLTFFSSYHEKFRNSFAHGTFNLDFKNNRYLMIGQENKTRASDLNFFLQLNNEIFFDDSSLIRETDLHRYLIQTVKARAERMFGKTNNVDVEILSQNRYVTIDKHSLKDKIEQYCYENSIENKIFILTEVSNSLFKSKYFNDNNIKIIPRNKILVYLGLNIKIVEH